MVSSNRFIHSAHHLVVGFALTLKGLDKISHHFVLGGIILLFGLIILVYFFYLIFKKHPLKKLDGIIHWFEAIASLFTAYVYWQEGATYLPYVFLAASIGFFIAIIVSGKKHK